MEVFLPISVFIGNNAVPSKREDMYPIGVKSIEVCFDYCKGKRDREGTTWDTVLYIENKADMKRCDCFKKALGPYKWDPTKSGYSLYRFV